MGLYSLCLCYYKVLVSSEGCQTKNNKVSPVLNHITTLISSFDLKIAFSAPRTDISQLSSEISTQAEEKSPPHEGRVFVDWDGPCDPKNPRNWSFRHRWVATVVVSLFTFMRYSTRSYFNNHWIITIPLRLVPWRQA